MSRIEYLEELYQQTIHNLYCYSDDCFMEKPKAEYKDEWNKELEKLELIEELIDEEKNNKFHLYTSMFNLRNNKEERCHIDLAYLEDREKSISCYLSIDGFEEEKKPEYMLVLSLHNKYDFDEFENIYTKTVSPKAFFARETLKKEMQEALDEFNKFIEEDKKTNRFYSKYYEKNKQDNIETEGQVLNESKEYKITSKQYVFTDKKDVLEYCEGNSKLCESIKEQYDKGIQYKLILTLDSNDNNASAMLFARKPEEQDFKEIKSDEIDKESALWFLGYANEEEFLNDINDYTNNKESEEEL